MIERFSEAMGMALVDNKFSHLCENTSVRTQFHWKFHFTLRQTWLVGKFLLQSIKTFLTHELGQYSKSGSRFFSSEPVAASRDCCWLAEDPQLRLENSSRTHVLHAFVGMQTFPEGVCGIHEVMLFTLNPCDAPLWPSDPPMWSDLPKTPKRQDILRRSELVKKWCCCSIFG